VGLEVIQVLQHDAEVNAQNDKGITPLREASVKGRLAPCSNCWTMEQMRMRATSLESLLATYHGSDDASRSDNYRPSTPLDEKVRYGIFILVNLKMVLIRICSTLA
jgi:hypothetical protein